MPALRNRKKFLLLAIEIDYGEGRVQTDNWALDKFLGNPYAPEHEFELTSVEYIVEKAFEAKERMNECQQKLEQTMNRISTN